MPISRNKGKNRGRLALSHVRPQLFLLHFFKLLTMYVQIGPSLLERTNPAGIPSAVVVVDTLRHIDQVDLSAVWFLKRSMTRKADERVAG